MKCTMVILAAVAAMASLGFGADEIGFVEDFALAGDRAKALEQLIPGTRDFYYYNCLHQQNLGNMDEVDDILKAWIARYNRTGRVVEIENRQALLRYRKNPRKSLEYVRRQLGIRFNHRRDTLDARITLAASLDQNLISRNTLKQRAMARHTKTLGGFENSALDWLIGTDLSADRRRKLLARLGRPDHAGMVGAVLADLAQPHSRGFGSLNIHRGLLKSQLDDLLARNAKLLNNSQFVNIYLTKLRAGADVDITYDTAARAAYLEGLWTFVSRLSPAFNSLKANVLHRRLVHDRDLGVYDRERFMTYIKLPRRAVYVRPEYYNSRERRNVLANLNANYLRYMPIPPVGNDEPLVRDYLLHFFAADKDYDAYSEYLRDDYLKPYFAEAKIVNGIGDMEKWYSMLSPSRYQTLKERVDLDFAHTNKKLFSPDDEVSLDVHVKNVKTLFVKVFEINAANYYRRNGREVSTDIELDGLVANQEMAHKYTAPPLRRIKRTFALKGLKRRGTYVVEFIGNGKSSRALIRKGKLRYIARTSTAGHVFTIFDERNKKVDNAGIWLSGHSYKADEDGAITVPFSTNPKSQPIILSVGDFACLDKFNHEAETYTLSAGIHVARETLLNRGTASVIIRPALYVNGTPVTLTVLTDVRLVIRSVDHDGVVATKNAKDFKLSEAGETTYDFQVPARLSSILFTLTAKIKNLSRNKKDNLATSALFSLNSIDHTDKVEDLYLIHAGGVYSVDILGRNGEAKAARPINFTLKHHDFRDTIHVTLQSDKAGRVKLGALKDIDWLRAAGPEGTTHTWHMSKDMHTYPSSVHGVAGQALQIPYMGTARKTARSELSLLEVRGGTFVADRFDSLSLKNGMIVIDDLPAGDYNLLIKPSSTTIAVRLTAGAAGYGYAMSKTRHLEIRNARPLQIASVSADAKKLNIRLTNATKFARVHVVATRFMPDYPMYANLGRIGMMDPLFVRLARSQSQYIEGRNIGDEYRYIIERKYAVKFPGNMLRRPELLLNPWAIRKTDAGKLIGAAGETFAKMATSRAPRRAKSSLRQARSGDTQNFANLDFLGQPAAVFVNVPVNADGVASIELTKLGAHHQLHIVAVDPENTVYRELTLAEAKSQTNDLRLIAMALDPKGHFTQQNQITVVPGGKELVIGDITTAKFEVYDNLAKVYGLYVALSGNANLTEFSFILNWPDMKEEEKRAKYAKYACHELNFFLYRRDEAFFRDVVKPYLKNKKDKTFLDHYLIGSDLSAYMKPWAHARLNVVERVLLAQRIKNEQAATKRHVKDLYDLIPPDIERFNFLFNSALKGRSLDTGDGYGVDEARNKIKSDSIRYGGKADSDRNFALSTKKRLAPAGSLRISAGLGGRKDGTGNVEWKKKQSRGRAVAHKPANNMVYLVKDDKRRQNLSRLYTKLDKTREWVENNYYHLPIEQQNAGLITANAFWRDYAAQIAGGEKFFSRNLAEASRNFSEMMFALAVLDLPFKAAENKHNIDGGKFTLSPAGGVVVFHQEIKQAQKAPEQTPILVSQNFFMLKDRYSHVNNERHDKYVTDEFLVHTVYGCQVVVTNPTSTRQKLDILVQIPRGAIAVLKGKATRSVHIDLQPYSTKKFDYYFYFPQIGKWDHYPVHVSRNGKLLTSSEAVNLNVVARLSKIDRTSWDYISQHGTSEETTKFLEQNNINRIKLDRIAWRMRDADFFSSTISLLAKRHVYDHTLWSYAIKHDKTAAAAEYLRHADGFVKRCGAYIDTDLLKIDPVERKTYQHMEYSPLVNARSHRLGKDRRIVNSRFRGQYLRLMNVLTFKASLDNDDLMAVTYYMLLQDRVSEAMTFFARVQPAELATTLQYDYFKAYMAFYRADVATARKIAQGYAKHPADRWRKAFANVVAQADEIEGKTVKTVDDEDRTQTQGALAAGEPSMEFTVDARKVTVNYRNLTECRVNYYLMDLELLFSRQPFVGKFSGQFSYIRPNASEVVKLPVNGVKHVFELPEKFHNSNVMIEISAAGLKKSQAYYSNALAVQMVENYGQVRVNGPDGDGKALPKVYVKVYARMKNGQVKFYKDGYTDLRGWFDYTSLNTNELDNVGRFSLLILSETHGAVVREAAPPKR